MILSREIVIGEEHMIAGADLVGGVEGFDYLRHPVALYEGKLFMVGEDRFISTQKAEQDMNMKEDNELQQKGAKALGFHINEVMTGLIRFPQADFDTKAVWREVMILPPEVWQKLEALNV